MKDPTTGKYHCACGKKYSYTAGLCKHLKKCKYEELSNSDDKDIDVLEKEKGNQTIKGDLVKSAFLTSTMGVSYKLKLPKSI